MISTQTLTGVTSNPWAALIYLPLIGAFTYALRRLPVRLYLLLKSLFSVSLRIDAGSEAGTAMTQAFLSWYMKTESAKRTKRFVLEPTHEDLYSRAKGITGSRVLLPGFGVHFFSIGKTLCWFSYARKEEGNVSRKVLEITFLTRKTEVIHTLVDLIRYRPRDNQIAIYTPRGGTMRSGDWELFKMRRKRSLQSVVIKTAIKEKIVEEIGSFYKERSWYDERGINYKLTYLLHGLPGTGKSSFIAALASHFNRSIYMVNLGTISNEALQLCISNIPRNAFIVFEDVDVGTATKSRDLARNEPPETVQNKSQLSMSTIFNLLDGIASLNGNVVLITTNHLECLDAALTRKGRIDHILEIPMLCDPEVREYAKLVYPDCVPDTTVQYSPICGCDLQALFLEHKSDFQGFISSLKTTE